MYVKVWILEDEYFILNGIEMLVSGACPAAEIRCFSSAVSALKALENDHPDIIIADIVMGAVSGLDFLAQVKEKNLPYRAILVSGHENFDFARRAIGLNVEAYLLKPIDQDELIRKFNGILEQLAVTDQATEIDEYVTRVLYFGSSLPASVQQQCPPALAEISTPCLLILIEAGVLLPKCAPLQDQAEIESLFEICGAESMIITPESGKYLILSPISPETGRMIASAVRVLLRRKYETVRIGIGGTVGSVSDLYPAYSAALLDAQANEAEILPARSIKASGKQIISLLYRSISKGHFTELMQYLYRYLEICQVDNDESLFYLLSFCRDELYRFLLKLYGNHYIAADMPLSDAAPEDLISFRMRTIPGSPSQEKDIIDLQKNLLLLYNIVKDLPPLESADRKVLLCLIIDRLISLDCKNISLDLIGDLLGVSASYISSAYREVRNTSLKQQIITEKMKRSEELLSTTGMTIPEIANSVGYYDIKHFRKTLQQYLQKGNKLNDMT